MTAIHSTTTFHNPIAIPRAGCSCQVTSLYQKSIKTEERTDLVRQFTAMRLVHRSKTGAEKCALNLDDVHDQLKLDSLKVDGSGASNILVCSVSFDCKIIGAQNNQRKFLTFDLKIPGMNSEENSVFSYDSIAEIYETKSKLYSALKFFYEKGRDFANPERLTHGHAPDYNPDSSSHDQYIRHTEQLLVAYLARPEATTMLRNRLRAEIRANYSDASSVKVYNMVLHMHSTKTCCAPCEYSLLGLMNERGGQLERNVETQKWVFHGFLHNFTNIHNSSDERLSFTYPKNSRFQFIVTVTAKETDADHRKPPRYSSSNLGEQALIPRVEINVKDPTASLRIWTTLFTENYDKRREAPTSTLGDRTVAISGSLSTKGSPGTINRVKKVKNEDDNQFTKLFSRMLLKDS